MNYNCPNLNCSSYQKPDFVIKDGFFFRKNDSRKVQRFRCKKCGSRFCSQTHKLEYYQKKRRINFPLFKLICSGVSMRRAAIILNINKTTIERRIPYMGQKYRKKNQILLKNKKITQKLQFDDLITKENSKLKPLSVSIAVDKETRFILGAKVSQIPSFGHLSKVAKNKYGKRKCHHKQGLKALFEQIKVFVDPNSLIESDEHQNYPEFVKRYFPRSEFIQHKSERAHIAGLGELKKVSFDPLFTINHTSAMFRDNLNRLVRRTWCTTKKVQALQDQLDMFIYYHNHYYLKRLTPI